jgi:acetylglutamate kinase
MVDAQTRARMLAEALPYIREFADKVMVVKLGGHAMLDPELERCFAEDVVLLKAVGINPVVAKLGVECRFVQGMRVTDAQTLDVVEMVLGGTVNGRIVTRINTAGGIAIGLSGRDGNLIQARPYRLPVASEERTPELIDLGHVGEVEDVNADLLLHLCARRMVPVIAPLGVDAAGQAYNINADLVAGAVASRLRAEKLILLTDVAGVMDQDGKLLGRLTSQSARVMTESGVIRGGMIPKVKCALDAMAAGVNKAHIIDGRIPHALLLEIFTDAGVGTEIVGE